ncbi:MAG: 2,3-bisphosphoglycerate-independent phosphoglycerate mutase [Firmicutes bacterium]|nr:2,3-bisphosphoglycerate-independent phosphoglycerate mutase [Bacillota bacterium]
MLNKTVLCIVDGVGVAPKNDGNATRFMANFWNMYDTLPSLKLRASGHEVGLSDERDAGNSEVGHNAIGAGRVIRQGLSLLNDTLKSGEAFTTKTWNTLIKNARSTKLNIITLLSDGRVHSDLAHLFTVLEQCARESIIVSIHALADGRDVPPQSILSFINKTNEFIAECGVDAKIATLGGRGRVLMDRYESNIPTMKLGAEMLTATAGTRVADLDELEMVIKSEYDRNPTMTDESLPPYIIDVDGAVKNGDSILLLNYRGDRAIQMCKMFETGEYIPNSLYKKFDDCFFAGALQYDTEASLPENFLCPPPVITDTLTEHLVANNVRQFAIAETVKFGHVTYFFNGNRTLPFDKKLETWIEVLSDTDLGTAFNKRPEMKARDITARAITAIKSDKFDFIRLNLANPDMVGHTADIDATIAACLVVDECVKQLADACRAAGANLILTSDHGNAEEMVERDKPKSSHTNRPVPLILVTPNGYELQRGDFGLTNIAATICELLGVPIPTHFNQSMLKQPK